MSDIMDKIAAKRKAILGQELHVDMIQRDIKKSKVPPTPGTDGSQNVSGQYENATGDDCNADGGGNNAEQDKGGAKRIAKGNSGPAEPASRGTSSTDKRRSTRRGRCVFGCPATTNLRKGVQVWNIVPVPSP